MNEKVCLYDFPEAKGIVVSGDIHGEFNELKYLKTKNHPLRHWFYGHFHHSWHQEIDGVQYNMLDIMELRELR